MAERAVRRRAGDVERAVRRDLRGLDEKTRAGRATMAQLALVLARAIDARGSEGPTTTAKLVQELRAVMSTLRGSSDDGDAAAFEARMSTPVRDSAVAGAGDVGAAGGGDSGAAG